MNDNVIQLSDHQPHVNVEVGEAIHVFPVRCIESVVAGTLPLSALGDDVMRKIVGEWLDWVRR